VTGFKKEPRESWPRLGSKKREGGAFGQSQEREGKMAAGSLAPNSANEIKQAKLALVGLAGQNWPISNTPEVMRCKPRTWASTGFHSVRSQCLSQLSYKHLASVTTRG
jgi:hypothetical protein